MWTRLVLELSKTVELLLKCKDKITDYWKHATKHTEDASSMLFVTAVSSKQASFGSCFSTITGLEKGRRVGKGHIYLLKAKNTKSKASELTPLTNVPIRLNRSEA